MYAHFLKRFRESWTLCFFFLLTMSHDDINLRLEDGEVSDYDYEEDFASNVGGSFNPSNDPSTSGCSSPAATLLKEFGVVL